MTTTAERGTAAHRSRNGSGSITRTATGRWAARCSIPGKGQRRLGTFDTQGEAQRAITAALVRATVPELRRLAAHAETPPMTLDEYLPLWFAQRTDLKPTTVENYTRHSQRFILAPLQRADGEPPLCLGNLAIADIRTPIISVWLAAVKLSTRGQREYRAQRDAERRQLTDAQAARWWATKQGRAVASTGRLPADVTTAWNRAGSPRPTSTPLSVPGDAGTASARAAAILLRAILADAERADIISRAPKFPRRAFAEVRQERPTASPTEVDGIAAALPLHLAAFPIVVAWAGLRRGEALGLRRRDVEIIARPSGETLGAIITVERNAVTVAGRTVIGTPKTEAGHRAVHLPKRPAEILASHLASHVAPTDDAPLFHGERGGVIDPRRMGRWFAQARSAVGRRDLTIHGLRHSGATWADSAGVPLETLSRRLGHSDVAITKRYVHSETLSADVRAAELIQEWAAA